MGSAQVSLAPLQLGAVAGALNVNLDMELRKRRRPPVVPRARRAIRKLNAEIELSQAGTVDLLVFWARLMGVPAEQALARVRPVVAEAAGKWAAMGLLKIENDTVRSTLSITMDEVDVNGQGCLLTNSCDGSRLAMEPPGTRRLRRWLNKTRCLADTYGNRTRPDSVRRSRHPATRTVAHPRRNGRRAAMRIPVLVSTNQQGHRRRIVDRAQRTAAMRAEGAAGIVR